MRTIKWITLAEQRLTKSVRQRNARLPMAP
jgi:hypothetical protein